jgi:hypothetical protein
MAATSCPACGRALAESDTPRAIQDGENGAYHLRCAPAGLLRQADEEWSAVLRKGVRYFVAKYGISGAVIDARSPAISPSHGDEIGAVFLELGKAVREELDRRTAP